MARKMPSNRFSCLAPVGPDDDINKYGACADVAVAQVPSTVVKKTTKKSKRRACKPTASQPESAVPAPARATHPLEAHAKPAVRPIRLPIKGMLLMLALALLVGFVSRPDAHSGTPEVPKSAKHPVVIVPGFITSHLEVWQGRPCATAGGRGARARAWGSLSMLKFLARPSCWMQHLSLDSTGLDPPGIKVRAVQGVYGAQDFLPFYTIWGKVVSALAAVGYDTANLAVVPYDWRLGMPQMEVRDGWFSNTRSTIEAMVQRTREKAVLISHSCGENVARAFLHWVEAQQPGWVETHVHAHTAVAGPSLGLPTAVPMLLSGEMFDIVKGGPILEALLPSSERTEMLRSWKSFIGLLPHGGPKVWGNATWAPDDTPAIQSAGRSFGAIVARKATSCVRADPCASTGLHMGQAVYMALRAAGSNLNRDVPLPAKALHSRFNATARRQLPRLPNPLTTPLPHAPSLKLFYLYGVGIPTERAYHYQSTAARQPVVDTTRNDATTGLDKGVQLADGDLTVPLLSLGGLSRGGWRSKRLNPAGIQVVTKEYQHMPSSPLADLRGGPATAKHVDILVNTELLSDLVSIATGAGHKVHTRVVSSIDSIVARIPWESRHGWH